MGKAARRAERWGAVVGAAVLAVTILSPVPSPADTGTGCDFGVSPPTPSCSPPLPGSTFAAGDGNLMTNPTTFGTTDWENVAGLNTAVDLTNPDNIFGGAGNINEANPTVTVINGTATPAKSDLTRFYEAAEFAGGHNFLYLGWERVAGNGSANVDFEINQVATPGLGTPDGVARTINRTAGDLLVSYDFSGSGTPTITLLTWLTTGPAAQCNIGNTVPCWGNQRTLNGTVAIGAVNSLGTVTDPLQTPPAILATNTFGEAAIDLTAAGVFPPGLCTAFGSAFAKSRTSASVSSSLVDIISPIAVHVSNCGEINIHKVTENGDGTFGYTTTGGLDPATFSLSNGGTQSFPNTANSNQVAPGTYSVTESSLPPGWTLRDLACTATGAGTSASTSGSTASITVDRQGVVDCTYTNHTNLSPTITTALSPPSAAIGGAVHDTATLTGATAGAGGTVTYTVYTDDTCTTRATTPQISGQPPIVTVTGGVVPPSADVTFNQAGTYFWQAAYSGDANNNPATSTCLSEPITVGQNVPTIATTLSANTSAIGIGVHDTATLSGATTNAGGTVTYTVYTDSACTTPATTQISGQPPVVTVTGGVVPDSGSVIFNAAGTYFWRASYSGDVNNSAATSPCTSEPFLVSRNSPTIATTVVTSSPQRAPATIIDSATLTGATADAGARSPTASTPVPVRVPA